MKKRTSQRGAESDTRKGFKFTKKSEQSLTPTVVETVAFEDLDEELTSPVGKRRVSMSPKKRSRSTNDITVESTDQTEKDIQITKQPAARTGTIHRTERKKPDKLSPNLVADLDSEANSKVLKAYYPRIPYSSYLSEAIKEISSLDISHKDILLQVIRKICHEESTGLQEYSNENVGREAIISFLQDVLNQLPDAVFAATDQGIHYSPELLSDEQAEIESLAVTLSGLKARSAALDKLVNNISELGPLYNIWIQGAPELPIVEHRTVSNEVLDVSNFAHEYGEKLSEITTQCDSLIGLNRDLDSAKTEARIAQGALYDAAQSVRAKSSSSKVGSTDPKDLIRNFVAL